MWMGSAAAPSAAIQLVFLRRHRTLLRDESRLYESDRLRQPSQDHEPQLRRVRSRNGASGNAIPHSRFSRRFAEGISVFVAAGDEGAASCDAGATSATHGIGVSGFASTLNNVASAATDFGDSSLGTNANYWSSSNGPN